jgi:hypothetical protein
MIKLLVCLLLTSCAAFGSGHSVDLTALADKVELYRADVMDLSPVATPATQAQLARLSDATLKVEAALRAAGAGGPISTVQAAAGAALEVAEQVIAEMQKQGKDTGDAQFVVGLAKILLRHLAAGDVGGAAKL